MLLLFRRMISLTIYLPNFRLKVARERQEQMAKKRQMSEKADEKTQIVCQWHSDTVSQNWDDLKASLLGSSSSPRNRNIVFVFLWKCDHLQLNYKERPLYGQPMLFCTTFFEEEKTACWFNHTVLHLNIFHIYALIRYNVTKPCIIAIALKEANKKLTHLLIRSLTSYQYFIFFGKNLF